MVDRPLQQELGTDPMLGRGAVDMSIGTGTIILLFLLPSVNPIYCLLMSALPLLQLVKSIYIS